MKKIVSALLLLTLVSASSFAKNELVLKVKYKPETTYSQTIEQNTQTEMSYSGTEDFLNKLKDQGMVNPTINTLQSKIEALLKTEKLVNDTLFPLTIEFVKSTSLDGKKAIPDGTIIYGHSTIKSMPTLDSIVSKDMDESIKKSVLPMMQSMFSQIPFPEDKLVKVGEGFSMETPLTLPMPGMSLDMNITTYYKLLSIDKGIGNFDISQTYTVKSALSGFDVTATGNGKGTLAYDIKKEFYSNYKVDLDIVMSMKKDLFTINIKTKTGVAQTIEISKR